MASPMELNKQSYRSVADRGVDTTATRFSHCFVLPHACGTSIVALVESLHSHGSWPAFPRNITTNVPDLPPTEKWQRSTLIGGSFVRCVLALFVSLRMTRYGTPTAKAASECAGVGMAGAMSRGRLVPARHLSVELKAESLRRPYYFSHTAILNKSCFVGLKILLRARILRHWWGNRDIVIGVGGWEKTDPRFDHHLWQGRPRNS
jgi:hypothetical protein